MKKQSQFKLIRHTLHTNHRNRINLSSSKQFVWHIIFHINLLIFSSVIDFQLFSILFFFMLFVLGIGSNIAMCTCVITILRDRFKALKAWQAAIGLSTFGFLFGLVYVTPVSSFIHLKKINDLNLNYSIIELLVTQINNYHSIHYATQTTGWTVHTELGGFLWSIIYCVHACDC